MRTFFFVPLPRLRRGCACRGIIAIGIIFFAVPLLLCPQACAEPSPIFNFGWDLLAQSGETHVALADVPVVIGPALASAPDVSAGEVLISELNCAACHRAPNDGVARLARTSPVLGKTGMRITPQYLRRFLANPANYK